MSKYEYKLASVADIDRCIKCAEEFHNVYEPGAHFSEMAWRHFWVPIVERGGGVMLLLEHLGEVVGGIGGLLTRFQTSMELHLVEMFWWVNKEHRGFSALKLLGMFEDWGRDQGADSVLMTLMESSEPEKVEALYLKNGYTPFERHFRKSLEENKS